MKHDIDAINAALCLGDVFFPPRGTVCRIMFRSDGHYKSHCVTRAIEKVGGGLAARMKGTLLEWLDISGPGLKDVGYEIFWYPERLREVRRVPSCAPPFEDWDRP